MPATVLTAPIKGELSTAHELAMHCAARANRFLDRAASAACPRLDPRTSLEAHRMAMLAARLMEGVERVMPRLRGRPDMDLDHVLRSSGSSTGRSAGSVGEESGPAVSAPPKLHAALGQRRGCLKNGNPAGDYLKSARCGARTRAGCACRQPAMANGRCRLHGGLSTGPRTSAGLARCRTARLTHGYRSGELIGLRRRAAHAARRLRGLTRALSAGHGVHRSDSRSPVGALCARPSSSPTVSSPMDSRLNGPWARAARPYTNRSDAGASAGHGLHRPILKPEAIGVHLRSSAAKPASPAGHGLHRSDRADRRPLT